MMYVGCIIAQKVTNDIKKIFFLIFSNIPMNVRKLKVSEGY